MQERGLPSPDRSPRAGSGRADPSPGPIGHAGGVVDHPPAVVLDHDEVQRVNAATATDVAFESHFELGHRRIDVEVVVAGAVGVCRLRSGGPSERVTGDGLVSGRGDVPVGTVGPPARRGDSLVLGVFVADERVDQILNVVGFAPVLEEAVEGSRDPVLGYRAAGGLGVEAIARVLVEHLPNRLILAADRGAAPGELLAEVLPVVAGVVATAQEAACGIRQPGVDAADVIVDVGSVILLGPGSQGLHPPLLPRGPGHVTVGVLDAVEQLVG